jgi:ADP-ribose pyrophosphatase YjhB (NUDIX family)
MAQSVGEYLEPGYAPQPQQTIMDDVTYAKALDAIVVACVDIALTKNGQILLGKRTRHPQPDWWIVGGRMRAGETFAKAAVRLLYNELRTPITPERLVPLTVFAAAWNQRAFEPVSNGTHTLSVVMTVEVSDEEAQNMRFNDEYSDHGWTNFATIAGNEQLHPAVRQVAQALLEKNSV